MQVLKGDMIYIAHGSINITPVSSMPLAGFPDRKGDFEGVASELEISLIVLKQAGLYLFVYSIDTLFVPDRLAKAIVDKYRSSLNLQDSNVWMHATHTHFAPLLDEAIPGLGEFNPGYYSFVESQLLTLTDQVLNNGFKEVFLSYQERDAPISVSRRKRMLRMQELKPRLKTLLYPDYNKAIDTNVSLVKFINANGDTEAVLWSYACHPVHYVNRQNVSAEYIGAIREKIQGYYAMPCTVLFMQGFSGDIKADITVVTNTRLIDRVRYFFQYKPKFTNFPSLADYNKWIDILWESVIGCLDSKNISAPGCNMKISDSKLIVDDLRHNGHSVVLKLKRVTFQNIFSIIGVSAEVTNGYVNIVRSIFPQQHIITSGCQNGTCIYLPADKQVRQGGYEIDGFKKLFGVSGWLSQSIEKRVKKALRALIS